MVTTRRALLGKAAAVSAVMTMLPGASVAQDGTPIAGGDIEPGFAAVRVRTLPSAELNQAIFPDVMASVLPPIAALPGFHGYTFVFDDADPATAFTLSTFATEEAAPDSVEVAQMYVEALDSRFVMETPLSIEGRVRMYATTGTPAAELPPFLNGAVFTIRDQTTAPGINIEDAISIAQEILIPVFLSLPGFVLYCWFERPGGRVAINIWETAADLEAASEALVAWREEHFTTPTASEEVAYRGTIGYSRITGLT